MTRFPVSTEIGAAPLTQLSFMRDTAWRGRRACSERLRSTERRRNGFPAVREYSGTPGVLKGL